jgi:hypothetical protein
VLSEKFKVSWCTGCILIIGRFRYAISWVGSIAISWNSCRLHTVNVTFGMVLQSLLPSHGKSVNQCWKEMAASPTECSWCALEFLWQFNARSNGNLDVVVLMRRWSEGGLNNFVREDASVIKERVARGGQLLPKRRLTECVKLSLSAPGNLLGEPVESWRCRIPQWGKFYGNDCSCARTNCNWWKILR